MEKFNKIQERAVKNKGSLSALNALLPKIVKSKTLKRLDDSYFLAEMTKKIFQSGFVWKVVENKWSGFESVFWQFDPNKLQFASDEQIEMMASDARIIRNYIKVKAVRDNAFFVQTIAKKHGSFGHFIAEWPDTEITQLWLFLKKEGARLGGNTGPYFLRTVGKDTFLLTRDVVTYLINHNIVDKHPNSQRDLKIVQNTFNDWQQQSGRSMAEISKIIACSVGSE